MKKYPNIGEHLEKKARHRRRLAALPFEEKIEMIFRLKARRDFFLSARVTGDARLTGTPIQLPPDARKKKTK